MNECFLPFKNKFENKRVFLIGNGPSLNSTNLDFLQNEYSIAMNRISLIYSQTKWRPTFYIFCSSNCQHQIWGKEWTRSIIESVSQPNTTSFIWKKYQNTIDPKKQYSIKWIENMSEYKPDTQGNILEKCFSNNIESRIDKSATTMNVALQLANYMGFSEIYLLGCDLGWSTDQGYNKDPNHFVKNYNADIPAYKVNKINYQMRNVHKLARANIDKSVKMFNASIKTTLDVYPIINFDTLMTNNKLEFRTKEMDENAKKWL